MALSLRGCCGSGRGQLRKASAMQSPLKAPSLEGFHERFGRPLQRRKPLPKQSCQGAQSMFDTRLHCRKPLPIQSCQRAQSMQSSKREFQFKRKIALGIPLSVCFPFFPIIRIQLGQIAGPNILIRQSKLGEEFVEVLVAVAACSQFKWTFTMRPFSSIWTSVKWAFGAIHNGDDLGLTGMVDSSREVECSPPITAIEHQPLLSASSPFPCPVVYVMTAKSKVMMTSRGEVLMVNLDAEKLCFTQLFTVFQRRANFTTLIVEGKWDLSTDVIEKGGDCDCLLLVPTPEQVAVTRVLVNLGEDQTYLQIPQEHKVKYVTDGTGAVGENNGFSFNIFRFLIPQVGAGSRLNICVIYLVSMPFTLDPSMLHSVPSRFLSRPFAANTGDELEVETGSVGQPAEETESGPRHAPFSTEDGKAERSDSDCVASSCTGEKYMIGGQAGLAVVGPHAACFRSVGAGGGIYHIDFSLKYPLMRVPCCGDWEESHNGCQDCGMAFTSRFSTDACDSRGQVALGGKLGQNDLSIT